MARLLPAWGAWGLGLTLCGVAMALGLSELWGHGEGGPLRPEMVVVPAGTFMMGRSDDEVFEDEKPVHKVTISQSFAISVTEVTQEQYQRVMGQEPSDHKGQRDLPVENVSWVDAARYCNLLSQLEDSALPLCYKIDGDQVEWPRGAKCGYRLPTEAEWEYAARANQGTKYAGGNNLDEVAWKDRTRTYPVATKTPNAWGVYDMSGNVWEWVWDWHTGYTSEPVTDPRGPEAGSNRVDRGGSIVSAARYLRVAVRDQVSPGDRDGDLGFRVVRSSP